MSKICISLDCPMADILLKNGDGNFDCSKCQKTVYDFSGMSKEEFEQKIPEIQSQNLCGNYRLDQVDPNSNLTWKNRLNMKHMQWKNKSRFSIPALAFGLMIFLSGCHNRRLAGAYAEQQDLQKDKINIEDTERKA